MIHSLIHSSQDALSCESDCIEALYNLGLVNKKLELHEKALDYFNKLQRIVPNHAEVIYQIASLHEEMGDTKEAQDKYKWMINLVPSDPGILQRLGAIYAKQGDDFMAHQQYAEVGNFFEFSF